LTCTDTGLSQGTYNYTVTTVWQSWTATSSPAVAVPLASGALDHFVLSAATTSPTAGAADNLTITAKDSAGITVTAYNGSHNLTFAGAGTIGTYIPTVTNSGGIATNFGTATAITFTNGVATAGGVMTLYKAESVSLVVSDGSGHSNGAGLSLTVGPAGLNSFTIPTPATQTAGVPFNVLITAKDAYGNTVTGYTGSQCLTFSGPANSPNGTSPSYPAQGSCGSGRSAVTFLNGVAAAVPIALYNPSASTVLTATDAPSGKSGSTGAFTVNAGPIASFTIPTPPTQIAGNQFSISITAMDAYGSTATGYTGSKCLTFSGPANSPDGHVPLYPAQGGCAAGSSVTFTSGVAAAVPITLYNPSISTVLTATDTLSGRSGSTGAFTVSVGPVASLTITTPATQVAGVQFSVSITAKDAYGSTVMGYTGAQCLTFSGPGSSPNSTAPRYLALGSCAVGQSAVTFMNGVAAAVPITLYNASTSTVITATDTSLGVSGSTGAFTVNAAGTAGYTLTDSSGLPLGSQTAGTAFSVRLAAVDPYGNVTTSYSGAKTIAWSGPGSAPSGTAPSYPSSATSVTFVSGVGTATGIMLYKAETPTLQALGSGVPTLTGTATFTVNPSAISSLRLAAATTTPSAGQADNLTITALDTYGNTATSYSSSHSLTFSGATAIGSYNPTVSNSSGTAINFGSSTSINFTAGVATVSGASNGVMYLYRAGAANITVAEGVNTSNAVTITVGVGALDSFTMPTPATQAAGVPFNVSITAKDAYGNTKTDYTGAQCIAFSGPGSSPDGHAPVYPAPGSCVAGRAVTFASGVAGTVSITLYNAAPTTLTATDASTGKSGSTGAFTVNGGAQTRFLILPATTTLVAGAADNLTIIMGDPYGNPVTAYTGSHDLTFSGASTIGTHVPTVTTSIGTAINFGTATAITFTNGVATVSGSNNGVMRLYKVETANVTVRQNTGTAYTSNPVAFDVQPAAITTFNVADPATQTAGTAFNLSITATDTYGNANVGTRCLTFSGPGNSPNGTPPSYPAQGSCAAGQSQITFTGAPTLVPITLYRAGATTLTVTDVASDLSHTTASFTVSPAAIDHFSMTAAPTTATAGATDNLTITAIDPYGNTATSYTGRHDLTFSGAGSIRTYNPTVTTRLGVATNFGTATSITFTNGVSSAGGVMTLYKAQTAHLVVSDGSHQGNLDVTVSAAALSSLSLSAEKVVVRPGATDQLTIRAVDTYGNTAAGYGDGPHNLTFSGGAGTRTVTDLSGAQVNFGTSTQITFTNGVSTAGGVLRISSVQVASVLVTDGIHTSPALRIVVSSVVASAVSAGGFQTCALRSDGTVECWGSDSSGQLGNGNPLTNSSTPVIVSGLTNVTQIAAGKYHTCALRNDGTVWCWGENAYGQLGNSSTTDSSTPVEVLGVGGTGHLTGVTEIDADGQFTCALINDGTVRCWGHDQAGQLGIGSINNNANSTPLAVVGVGGHGTLGNVTSITIGANHACALISGGTVDCWGLDDHGQLGNGGAIPGTNSASPVQVEGPGGAGYLTGVTEISGGRLHNCALLSDHTVWCWGDNDNGELGDGTNTNRSVPVRAGQISTATSVSAGEYHSCALLADGTAQCWGAAAYGQVGDGTTADTSNPVTVIGPGGFGVLGGIGELSAGGGDITETDDYEHTCALMRDGTVVCWGQNNYGQLGDGTTTMSIFPVGVDLQ
jgi:alpha-tubulin suppressor-like RCC1 family protein